MERALLAGALVGVAVVLAWFLRRRRPQAPTGQVRHRVPGQLDRDDFEARDRPWLVVVFSSATCRSCEEAVAKAEVVAGPEVGFQEVSYQVRRDLHERYAVDVVPMVLVVDGDGVVQASFVGVPTATDLWAAVADARRPH